MSTTELVFSNLKPGVTQQLIAALRGSPAFQNIPGNLYKRIGHVVRHNGEDVTSQERIVLGLEWDKPSSFHAFYPASPQFSEFIGAIKEFVAAPPKPVLFTARPDYGRPVPTLSSAVTQIFIGPNGDKKPEGEQARATFLDLLKEAKERGEIDFERWGGLGIDDAEGTWLGLLGWKSEEELDKAMKGDGIAEAVKKLRNTEALDEYVVKFEEV
ncbi:hypothetical protein BDV96DRAFT_576202 [Lophiotrema nucula]|uniref:ABM domain-containing protein n=1 Tax=Lophiotrema nucula TaxID=690887 RepID=A0A6A5Z6K5_9PLEO|nr:hypothetical protein BDV96DRAFT_576202 [Lophiotrema nucula]